MLFKFLSFVFILPMAEAFLLFGCARLMGLTTTCVSMIITAVVGLILIKLEGFQGWPAVRASLWEGRVPEPAIINRVVIFIAGVLLMIPGLFTDFIGLLLLVPVVRSFVVRVSRGHIDNLMQAGNIRLYQWRS